MPAERMHGSKIASWQGLGSGSFDVLRRDSQIWDAGRILCTGGRCAKTSAGRYRRSQVIDVLVWESRWVFQDEEYVRLLAAADAQKKEAEKALCKRGRRA